MLARSLCPALRRWGLPLVAIALVTPAAASAKPPETFPLSKVRRGQKGYGLTTMKGTQPERFEFEVIGVNENFLPKMDIILVKSDDPKLAITGFWQGMSGSPLFIDGKLTCAFSYGFRFNKVAIGGCTPIDYMKKEGLRDARGIERETQPRNPAAGRRARIRLAPTSYRASRADWSRIVPGRDVAAAMTRPVDGTATSPWLLSSTLPKRPAKPAGWETGLSAASVPLAMSGFSPSAFAKAKELFADFPLEPMQAGGTGSTNRGPSEFTLGGSISVQLVRGHMSIAGTGTVSYLDGNKVLAFGHPMFQAGELYAPVTTAEVHTVIPSAMSAFVVASPMREVGSLIHDRQSTIAADTTLQTPMIPMHIEVEADGRKGRFDVELLNNRFFTPTLANISAMSAISLYMPDRDKATVLVKSKVTLRGHKPIVFTDHLYAEDGALSAIAGARGMRVLVPLLLNPFAPVEITGIELKAQVTYDTNFGNLHALRLPVSELPPGKRTYVTVELERYDGKKISERVPFDVPADLAGSIVKLEVTAGDAARIEAAPPETLEDLLEIFRSLLPGNTYAVTLYTANEGVAIGGRIVRDLPPSVADRLHPTSDTETTAIYRAMARSVSPASRVINGSLSTLIKVADND